MAHGCRRWWRRRRRRAARRWRTCLRRWSRAAAGRRWRCSLRPRLRRGSCLTAPLPSQVGLLASGHAAHAALCALLWSASEGRFGAAVLAGVYVCPRLRDLETGRAPAAPAAASHLVDALPALRSPLLLHGAEDTASPVSHARMVHHAACGAGVPSRLVTYPRQGHELEEESDLRDAAERACGWFLEHLQTAGEGGERPGLQPAPCA